MVNIGLVKVKDLQVNVKVITAKSKDLKLR